MVNESRENLVRRKVKENIVKEEKNKRNRPKAEKLKNVDNKGSFVMRHVKGLVILATFLVALAFVAKSDISNSLSFLHKCDLPVIYSIVFDAGSTGSRVHVFSFYNDSGNFLLIDEIFEELKPGLSSYADNPKKAAESLLPLLDIAKRKVPEDLQETTPVVLYATAGLRLLPGKQADDILVEVNSLLKKYPFHIPENAVKVMSGKDEAIFGWITINFLLGRFQDLSNTVAVMDLGGGSTQVTFLASNRETLKSDDIKVVSLFGQNLTLYARSYLGYGLMEARLDILGGTIFDHKKPNDPNKPLEMKSPCIVNGMSEIWNYRRVFYKAVGHNEPMERNFENCFVMTMPLSYAIFKPKELKKMELYAISYFYDRAVDSELIDEDSGGEEEVMDFYKKAKQYCTEKHDGSAFLCLDLTYITSLLWKGYDIDGLRTINLKKKINGIETSWCLGAALVELDSDSN